MTDPVTGRATLELAGRLLRDRTGREAARTVVGWLQAAAPEHHWSVLAIVDPEVSEVVAGPGEGARVQVATEPDGTVVVQGGPAGMPDAPMVLAIDAPLGTWGHLVTDGEAPAVADAAVAALEAALARWQERDGLRDEVDRLEEAQAVAHMGSYDWDITTDVNRWSDELYRIYGHEPQSFNATYDRFQSMIHPDDREMVQAIHQQAYATGEPYHTVERIVRPDGEVRVLDTTGRVIQDPAGRPVRMAGVCIDITERWEDQQAALRHAERFRLLVETAPEALLVVDAQSRVTEVNARAVELFGADRETLVGQELTALLPGGLPRSRDEAGHVAEARDRTGRRVDGSSFPADVTVGEADDDLAVAFVRDATDRLREEDQRHRDQAAQLRRLQALEINDNVLQGLSAAIYTLERGDPANALEVTRSTLASAQALVADLMSEIGEGGVVAGSLVRADPAPSMWPDDDTAEDEVADVRPPGTLPAQGGKAHRVVVVDDAEDLRMLFEFTLDATEDFEVVGSAADGQEALAVCQRERPDVVLLDLSMPVMDGLQALPLLRARLPDAVIVILSGFDAGHLQRQVLDLGAAAFIGKGTSQQAVVARLRELVTQPPQPRSATA